MPGFLKHLSHFRNDQFVTSYQNFTSLHGDNMGGKNMKNGGTEYHYVLDKFRILKSIQTHE